VDYLTAIWPVLLYLRDSGGTAERTTGPIGNIYRPVNFSRSTRSLSKTPIPFVSGVGHMR